MAAPPAGCSSSRRNRLAGRTSLTLCLLVRTPVPGRTDLFYDRGAASHKGRHPEHPRLPHPPAPKSYYDTNVFTTDPAQGAFIPGEDIPGTGVATFSGLVVDPAWGALPPTGPLNGIGSEIARITFLSVDAGAGYYLRDIVGELRASDAPDTPNGMPPMPTPVRFIPESNVVFGGVALTLFPARRRKRRGPCR